MKNANELSEGFLWILKNENRIRAHLQKVIPAYIEKAYEAASMVKSLIIQ